MFDLREYQTSAGHLADVLPWAALVGPGVVLNKDGSLQRTARFRGPDLDSATPAELIAVAGRLNNALRRLGSGWAIFVEAQRLPAAVYPESLFPDPVSRLVDAERRADFLEAGAHFDSAYFLTVLYLPPAERAGRAEAWLYEGRADRSVDWREVLAGFIDRTDRLLALIDGFVPEAAWLGDAETLTYLHSTISTRRQRVRVPETPMHLDVLLADEPHGSKDPTAVFVRHVWEKDIEQTLSAGRKASVEGAPLHRRTVRMTFGSQDAVAPENLLSTIETIVRDFGAGYATLKQALVEGAGGQNGSVLLTAMIEGVSREEVLKALVGEGGPLPVSSLRVSETRFGVTASREDLEGPGQLAVTPEGGPVSLLFMPPGAAAAVALPGRGYFATLATPQGPLHRFRVIADFIEMSGDIVGEVEVTAAYDWEARSPIRRIRQLLQLCSWLDEGDVEFRVDCERGNLCQGVWTSERIEGRGLWRAMAFLVSELVEVFPIDLWPEKSVFTLKDILDGRITIADFVTYLTVASSVWTFGDMNPEIDWNALTEVREKLGAGYLDLGEATLFAIFRAPIRDIAAGGEGSADFTLGQPVIVRRYVLPGGAAANWDFMRHQIAAERARRPPSLLFMDLPEQPDLIRLPGPVFGGGPPNESSSDSA